MKKLLVNYDLIIAGSQFPAENGIVSYYNADGVENGDFFNLTLEPNNPFDNLAVKVTNNGNKVGYVPKYENAEVFYYLSFPEQFKVECTLKKRLYNNDKLVVFIDVFAIKEDYQLCTIDVLMDFVKKRNKSVKEKKSTNRLGCFEYVIIFLLLFILMLFILF